MQKIIFNKRTSVNAQSCKTCDHNGANCLHGEMCPKLKYYYDSGTPEEKKFILDYLEKKKQENK